MNNDDELMNLHRLLTAEEQRGPLSSVAELAPRNKQREAICMQLAALQRVLHEYRQRFERLPTLPDRAGVQWAQQILRYPNGRLLLVDSLFPGEAASIVQVLLVDFTGQVHLSCCVATGYCLTASESRQFGISAQELQEAASLPHIWPKLLEETQGCYLLAYGWQQTCRVLEHEAERFQLEPAVLIGEDLLAWCVRFYQAAGLVELPSLCASIGHPLPACANIAERARGQLALLEAMAQGITRVLHEDQGTNVPITPESEHLA